MRLRKSQAAVIKVCSCYDLHATQTNSPHSASVLQASYLKTDNASPPCPSTIFTAVSFQSASVYVLGSAVMLMLAYIDDVTAARFTPDLLPTMLCQDQTKPGAIQARSHCDALLRMLRVPSTAGRMYACGSPTCMGAVPVSGEAV